MHRFGKLLGIIFIFCVVFFIICDEKGYNIGFENNRIAFEKIEEKPELVSEELLENVVYKNSDLDHLNYEFKNPKTLRKSDGMDSEYLANFEQGEVELEVKKNSQVYTGPNIISLNDGNLIYGYSYSGEYENGDIKVDEVSMNDIYGGFPIVTGDLSDEKNKINFGGVSEFFGNGALFVDNLDIKDGLLKIVHKFSYTIFLDKVLKSGNSFGSNQTVSNNQDIQDFEGNNLSGNEKKLDEMKDSVKIIENKIKQNGGLLSKGLQSTKLDDVGVYSDTGYDLNLNKLKEVVKIFVENNKTKNVYALNLKKGVHIQDSTGFGILESDIYNETIDNSFVFDDIDIDTLESENDEFLQQVFEKTKDVQVMNLIVENYLNEYQFVKAKNFIENLSELYYKDLKPSLNLRVAFNSFALTSKTTNETLTSLVQLYKNKNQISEEDGNWYLGILALMQRDYDKFFTIASSFTSDSHKAFVAKIQGYKDQISKQMGMPEYYFDTLVALELFNQGLFQPAKVLALYSLQQNSNYILPHQILAYANFLTNSWDTSVEYLKKLADLDQNNAEKYRFLMGVAYYWAEKYEQSVTMLSMIQNDNLRLDTQRYLINDYLQLDQKNKLILTRNKLLGYEDLVASDFYTYFYEVFYHPYSQGGQYQLYAFDTELANKMLRVCSMKLSDDERAVCTYGSIGRNIALGKFDGLEQHLLDLASQYPQGYLYQALGDYYIQQGDNDKAKVYLLKAASMVNNKSEISQIKKLLQDIM